MTFLAQQVRRARRPRAETAAPAHDCPKFLHGQAQVELALFGAPDWATFNAVTVALPKLLSERLDALVGSPATVGAVAVGAYVFGALAQYTIGNLLDRYPLKVVFLPLSLALAPLLFLSAGLQGVALLATSIGVIVGIFGQITINDAMVGKYTSDEWRARAYSVRYFLGFTAAGPSVGLVAWLHERGGLALMLQVFGLLCLLVIAGALIFPTEQRPGMRAQVARGMHSKYPIRGLRKPPLASCARSSRSNATSRPLQGRPLRLSLKFALGRYELVRSANSGCCETHSRAAIDWLHAALPNRWDSAAASGCRYFV